MRHITRSMALVAILALGAGVAVAGDLDDLWLHVRVDGDHGEKVSVNLPLALVEKAIPMIPDESFRNGEFVLDDVHWGHGNHLSLSDLRELWNELKSSPDMTFVTVEDDDETVRVSKSGGYLLVDTEDFGDESIEVRIPLAVVDALLSGDSESLDIRAAIQALAAHGEGELVAINGDDEQIKVWIDRSSATD